MVCGAETGMVCVTYLSRANISTRVHIISLCRGRMDNINISLYRDILVMHVAHTDRSLTCASPEHTQAHSQGVGGEISGCSSIPIPSSY